MGQDSGIWGTGNAHASNASKNPLGGFTGPGSGNHWSDQYRDPYHNSMLMSADAFNDFYGLSSGYGGTNYETAGELARSIVASNGLVISVGINGPGDGNGNIIPGEEFYVYYVDQASVGCADCVRYMQEARFGEYKEGLNVYGYLAGTSTTVNELYRGNEFLKAYNTDTRVALNRAFPGRFKGLSTNTLNKFVNYMDAKAIGKAFSKPLFGVGIVLTAIDVYQNDFSASSLAWGFVDTGIAIAAIAVSGPAAPFVAVGATLYFTG